MPALLFLGAGLNTSFNLVLTKVNHIAPVGTGGKTKMDWFRKQAGKAAAVSAYPSFPRSPLMPEN